MELQGPKGEINNKNFKVIRALQASAAILEWMEHAGVDVVLDLAQRVYGASFACGEGNHSIELMGIEVEHPSSMEECLRMWCGCAIRSVGTAYGDTLLNFFTAYSMLSNEKLVAITLHAAKLGLGSYIDPTVLTRRNTSSFYEVEMMGVLGRGDSAAGACQNWIDAATSIALSRSLTMRAAA